MPALQIERNANADRRPGCFDRVQMGKFCERLVASRFQRVDTKIERRACGKGSPFFRAIVAECFHKQWIEPFGIVAANRRGRIVKISIRNTLPLVVGERFGCEARTVEQLFNRIALESARKLQRAEQNGAWGLLAHKPSARGLSAECVVNQTCDSGAV